MSGSETMNQLVTIKEPRATIAVLGTSGWVAYAAEG
jgi:hypothetical protein